MNAGDEEPALHRGMANCNQIQYTTLEAVSTQSQDDNPSIIDMVKPLPKPGRPRVQRSAEMKRHSALHSRLAAELRA